MSLVIAVVLALLMLVVLYYDITRYIIPNWLVGLVLALYPIHVLLTPEPIDWAWSLAIFGLAFVIGYILFALRIMGGGDVKLLAVCCLWAGTEGAVHFLFGTALLGGLLAIGLMIGRPVYIGIAGKYFPDWPVPRILTIGEPLPYGVAIGIAFIISMAMVEIPGLALTL